jgi:HPt (histidine-containing phosphotransfer) domain-containing protein
MPDLAEAAVFDANQLRNICMEDVDLMRELAVSVVDDASSQIPALTDAIEQ